MRLQRAAEEVQETLFFNGDNAEFHPALAFKLAGLQSPGLKEKTLQGKDSMGIAAATKSYEGMLGNRESTLHFTINMILSKKYGFATDFIWPDGLVHPEYRPEYGLHTFTHGRVALFLA